MDEIVIAMVLAAAVACVLGIAISAIGIGIVATLLFRPSVLEWAEHDRRIREANQRLAEQNARGCRRTSGKCDLSRGSNHTFPTQKTGQI